VHLDHQSQPSRERSTELLRQRIAARAFPSEPVVVTGDFNVGESNPALATLLGPAAPTQQESQGAKAEPAAPKLAKAGPFVDTFRVVRPDEKRVGTFTGFKFGTIEGDKIDYILAEPGTEVMHAEIVRFSRNDHYPSDHFPVVARIRLKPANP
jgi:endonuclease/exonuclease/phosphatase family metal-dependent hydrolase